MVSSTDGGSTKGNGQQMKESRKPHERVETEIAVLREIASAVARERNVRRLLEDALGAIVW